MILNGGTFNNQRILGRRTIEIMAKDQLMHPEGGEANFRFGLGFQIYSGESAAWETINNASPMVSPVAPDWVQRNQLHIEPDGSIYPCYTLTNNEKYLGNIFDEKALERAISSTIFLNWKSTTVDTKPSTGTVSRFAKNGHR